MSWSPPKNDWGVDAVNSSDLNRIEENTITLHKGNGQSSLITIGTVTAGRIDINATDETFILNLSGYINLILSTGREPGNRIQLITLNVEAYLQSGGSQTGDYYPIRIVNEAASHQMLKYEVANLIFTGDYWYAMLGQ